MNILRILEEQKQQSEVEVQAVVDQNEQRQIKEQPENVDEEHFAGELSWIGNSRRDLVTAICRTTRKEPGTVEVL